MLTGKGIITTRDKTKTTFTLQALMLNSNSLCGCSHFHIDTTCRGSPVLTANNQKMSHMHSRGCNNSTCSEHASVVGHSIEIFVEYQWCRGWMNVTWPYRYRSHEKIRSHKGIKICFELLQSAVWTWPKICRTPALQNQLWTILAKFVKWENVEEEGRENKSTVKVTERAKISSRE